MPTQSLECDGNESGTRTSLAQGLIVEAAEQAASQITAQP